jgi:DNA-directed RNA polymerase specialized sigma24 family protein
MAELLNRLRWVLLRQVKLSEVEHRLPINAEELLDVLVVAVIEQLPSWNPKRAGVVTFAQVVARSAIREAQGHLLPGITVPRDSLRAFLGGKPDADVAHAVRIVSLSDPSVAQPADDDSEEYQELDVPSCPSPGAPAAGPWFVEVVSALTTTQRNVVVLRCQGLTNAAIAEELSVDVPAVGKTLRRAVASIKRRIIDNFPEAEGDDDELLSATRQTIASTDETDGNPAAYYQLAANVEELTLTQLLNVAHEVEWDPTPRTDLHAEPGYIDAVGGTATDPLRLAVRDAVTEVEEELSCGNLDEAWARKVLMRALGPLLGPCMKIEVSLMAAAA